MVQPTTATVSIDLGAAPAVSEAMIPTLATTVVEILSLHRDGPEAVERLMELARLDPSLAIRVLAIANSPSAAPVSPVLDVETAALRLGSRIAKEVVGSCSVLRVFVPTTRSHGLLWAHAVQTAVLARDLGAALNRSIAPGFLYTAGLLHDLGRLFMLAADPKGLLAVDRMGWESPDELVAAEAQIFGIGHAELGAVASARCDLPEQLVLVIENHHDRAGAMPLTGAVPSLMSLIQQADLWSCRLLHSPDVEGKDASRLLIHSALPEIAPLLAKCDLVALVAAARAITETQSRVLGLDRIED